MQLPLRRREGGLRPGHAARRWCSSPPTRAPRRSTPARRPATTPRSGSATPTRLITGAHTYRITYRLRGAINHFADHDELYLNVTGNGWAVPIDEVARDRDGPAPRHPGGLLRRARGLAAALPRRREGRDASPLRQPPTSRPTPGSRWWSASRPARSSPTPQPILEQRWTPAVGFATRPNTLVPAGVLLGAAVVGFALLTRRGRDRRFVGSAHRRGVRQRRARRHRGGPVPQRRPDRRSSSCRRTGCARARSAR